MVVELIAKDKNEKFQYEGRSKIIINSVSKLLLVEPLNEEYKMISAVFNWKFVAQKNILFVFAEHESQDFALSFDNPMKCIKVYGILMKNGAISGNKEFIKERFFLADFSNEISASDESSLKMKEVFCQWIEHHDGKEKEEFIQIIRNNAVFDLGVQNHGKTFCKQSAQKRTHSTKHIHGSNQSYIIVEKPNFEVYSCESRKGIIKMLIIFVDSFRSKCYEYACYNSSKLYYCCGCLSKKLSKKLSNKADIRQKEDGTDFVVLKSSKHVCETRKFYANRYTDREILDADNFKVFKFTRDGIDKSRLVVFTSLQKTTACYEYFWEKFKKKFLCCGCALKGKQISAKIILKQDGKNYLKLSRNKHVCESIEYDPEKYDIQKNEIVESSNFKIFKYMHNGTTKTKLVIFCETNKSLCYEYYLNKNAHLYQCCWCPRKYQVSATVIKGDEKSIDNRLMLGKNHHICDLLEFDPEKYKDDIILYKAMYKITYTTMSGRKIKTMNIFTCKEKKFYYKFIYAKRQKYYYCSKCLSSSKLLITATIQNERKENEYVYVSNQKHICDPLEFSSVFESNLIKAPNFQLIKRKYHGKILQKLIVFTNAEKGECFEYTWNQTYKRYICYPCGRYSHRVTAKIIKNDANEECACLSDNNHKCKPIEFVPEKSNIIKLPGFKLFETVLGKRNIKKLVIFDSKNKNLGYVYTYQEDRKNYVCLKCKRITMTRVNAKVLEDKNGEKFVELGKNEHVCGLQKL